MLNKLDADFSLRTVLASTADSSASQIQHLFPWNLSVALQTDSLQGA
jgi:Na+/H+ antiporter NhaC